MAETHENTQAFDVLEEINRPETRGKILDVPPSQIAVTHLPVDYYIDEKTGKQEKAFSTIHTDMLASLFSALQSLDPKELEGLYIQGRVLSRDQWEKLEYNPTFAFYLMSRKDRENDEIREHALRILVPNNITLTRNEVKSYLAKPFTVESLTDEAVHQVGWYPAKMLLDLQKRTTSVNEFLPIFGAVNELHVGSSKMSPNHLRVVNFRIQNRLLEWTHSVAANTRSKLTDKALSAVSRIINL